VVVLAKPNDLLAGILALQKTFQRHRSGLQSVGHVLAVAEQPGAVPAGQFLDDLAIAVEVIQNQKALDARPFHQQGPVHSGS